MNTPVLDFLRACAAGGVSRLHMPGHKGSGALGCEALDITEISGADDLSCPEGILLDSERSAAGLFGSRATFYSTGGSSQCVKAMLLLCARRSRSRAVLAARDVHRSFVNACALLDLRPEWLGAGTGSGYMDCAVTPSELQRRLESMREKPAAVYITSPNYLGRRQDIKFLSCIAHSFGVPLIVDNAHGAYLRFLEPDEHPLALGADMCCDSAHKTLPVLTGGAYLHVSRDSRLDFERDAREALGVFGSSSPSYLILASLDAANACLAEDYRGKLRRCCDETADIKRRLAAAHVPVLESDPLRITIAAHEAGYTGFELADMLRAHHAEPEFADRDFLVMMATPNNSHEDFQRVLSAFLGFTPRQKREPLLAPRQSEVCITPRQAMLSARETVPLEKAAGRVLASAAVTCPPAVPIAIMGERLSRGQTEAMRRYGLESVDVVIE